MGIVLVSQAERMIVASLAFVTACGVAAIVWAVWQLKNL